MKIQLIVKWYDMWIGMFWDSKNKWLYILPIPCMGIILKFSKKSIQKSKKNTLICPICKSVSGKLLIHENEELKYECFHCNIGRERLNGLLKEQILKEYGW